MGEVQDNSDAGVIVNGSFHSMFVNDNGKIKRIYPNGRYLIKKDFPLFERTTSAAPRERNTNSN